MNDMNLFHGCLEEFIAWKQLTHILATLGRVSFFIKHSCVITMPVFGYRYKHNSSTKLSETKEAVARFIDHF